MRFLTYIIFPLLSFSAMADAPPSPEALAFDVSIPETREALLERQRKLEAAGATSSADPAVQRSYIETLDALGYYDLAAEQYERMLTLQGESPRLLLELGTAWKKAGPYGKDKAFRAFKAALELDEDCIEARMSLAHLLHREGLLEQAERHYDRILVHQPDHVRARLGKAALLARDGDIQGASALFDQIGGAGQPYDVETRIMLRKSLFVFERHGGWFEDIARNHAAYARLLYRAGRITDALPAARRAVTLDPGDYNTWNFFAAMQLQFGNLEQAEQAYAKSLEANPDQPAIESTRRELINELTLRRHEKAP